MSYWVIKGADETVKIESVSEILNVPVVIGYSKKSADLSPSEKQELLKGMGIDIDELSRRITDRIYAKSLAYYQMMEIIKDEWSKAIIPDKE